MRKRITLAMLIVMMGMHAALQAQTSISLAGQWQFRIDRKDEGVTGRWYTQTFSDPVKLPGAMQAQGYGDNPSVQTKWIGDRYESFLTDEKYAPYRKDDNFKFPYWLTPKKYYMGAAWYQKVINIPADWKEKHITLTLERCHWGTTVYADDILIGADSSLATAHVYDLSKLKPGKHTLSIRVDNRYLVDVGINAHSASDQTQGTWNGIAGDIKLEAGSPVFIKHIQVNPDIKEKNIKVTVQLGHTGDQLPAGKLLVNAGNRPVATQTFDEKQETVSFTYAMGDDVKFWDEFSRAMYTLNVQLQAGNNRDTRRTTFGMRSVGTSGSKITINDRPIFLRGTLECAIFPLTGYPPTDTAAWGRIYRIIKAHGLNHMRFHSWCPPEAAFVAADNAGIYVSVEVDAWARLGDGAPIDQYLYTESNRIVDAYGNHPSFIMMIPSNEPAGDKDRDPYLASFVKYWKAKDSRHLYSAGSGWPTLPQNDYHCLPEPRIQGWGEGLKSLINDKAPNSAFDFKDKMKKIKYDKPVVAHEIGQWCVYPDFAERSKYTGLLQARNFDIFYDLMKKEGLQSQARDFLMASGKLQALCYKADIEAGMRTDYAGYQLLDLHDFPGQGSALVGILDPFWNSKPYFTPAAFHRFSSATVPLALINKFTWKNSETFSADVQVAHFGKSPLKQVPVNWKITRKDKRVLASGVFPSDLELKNDNAAGQVKFDLSGVRKAEKLNFEVSVKGLGVNDWDFWVYPAVVSTSAEDIVVTEELSSSVSSQLENGATVLLLLNNKIKKDKGADVKTGMSAIFWNTAWTEGQAPHTLGILCNPLLPVFSDFPTEFHSNWQWWDILHTAQPMRLNGLPLALKPTIQLIDTWFDAKKLGLMFEAKVGKGKLVVTSVDLQHDLDKRLGARQLYHSLLGYMKTKAFNPLVAVDVKQVKDLYE